MPVFVDTDIFISKSRAVHGNKYDYSQVNYTKQREPVKIICKEHGAFEQKPISHLRGRGCQICAINRTRKSHQHSIEDFMKRAKEVHGDTYDYSKVRYEGSKEKVCITCKTHGDFWQIPNSHFNKRGCPDCKSEKQSKRNLLSDATFLERAAEVHGDRYTYNRSVYKGVDHKLVITCKQHGDFEQSPSSHIRVGSGCPLCARTRSGWGHKGFYNTAQKSHIYLIRLTSDSESFVKVGLAKQPKHRHNRIKKLSGYNYELLCFKEGTADELYKLEQRVLYDCNLKKYRPNRQFHGSGECFQDHEDQNIINVIEENEICTMESQYGLTG